MIPVSVWAAGGYVYETKGDVSIATGKEASHPAVKNSKVMTNTVVSTGEQSHAILKFEDGQIVAMQANTAFSVREYRFEPKKIENSNVVFSTLKGGLLFITGLIGQRSKKSFRLTTPNATIGVRGTEFMVVMIDGALYGKVISGSVSMNNKAGAAIFKAGQFILASSPGTKPVAIPAEALPSGVFGQLEAIQLPPADPAPLPVSTADEAISIPLVDTASIVTGSALLSMAAAFAGGASVVAMPPGVSAAGLLAVAASGDVLPSPVSAGIVTAQSEAIAQTGAVAAAGSPAANPALVVAKAPEAWYDDIVAPSRNTPAAASTPAQAGVAAGDARLFGKHNFTPGRVGTGEICVFCHAPQGSETNVAVPLWNRSISPLSEYKAYSSVGSATAAATGSISMACLSCHDGTQAPNVVINSPASYADPGIYPKGYEPTQVSSSNYLKDHHPVSMLYGGGGQSDKQPDAPVDALATFNSASYDVLAVRKLTAPSDATARSVPFQDSVYKEGEAGQFTKQDFNLTEHSGSGSGTVWWLESKGTGKGRQKSDFYLYTRTDTVDGLTLNRPYVECSSCHDPHSSNPTFLRINSSRSAVCLTCHAK